MPGHARNRRRTQQERRESTRSALLDATVRCLGRDGYAATSISSIIKEAGVSRGALLHHFPSKNELIGAAIHQFYRQRLDRFKASFVDAEAGELSFQDRLQVLRDDFNTWYETALEIEVAMRTNPEVARIHAELSSLDNESMVREYEQLFPEFAGTGHAADLIGVSCYLMRGLSGDSRRAENDERFRLIVRMIQGYLEDVAGA